MNSAEPSRFIFSHNELQVIQKDLMYHYIQLCDMCKGIYRQMEMWETSIALHADIINSLSFQRSQAAMVTALMMNERKNAHESVSSRSKCTFHYALPITRCTCPLAQTFRLKTWLVETSCKIGQAIDKDYEQVLGMLGSLARPGMVETDAVNVAICLELCDSSFLQSFCALRESISKQIRRIEKNISATYATHDTCTFRITQARFT